jgi:hypothetical protein
VTFCENLRSTCLMLIPIGLASPFAKASDFAKASSDKSEDKSEASLHGYSTNHLSPITSHFSRFTCFRDV